MRNNNAVRNAIGGALAALVICGPARADVVGDWTYIAKETVQSQQSRPAVASQDLATAYIALFEAMNYVEGKYSARYLVKPQKPVGVSAEAAGASAMHRVLSDLYPARKDVLDAQLRGTLLAIPGSEHSAAEEIGSELGQIVRVARAAERPDPIAFPATGAGAVDSVASATAWAGKVYRSAEDRELEPMETARLYARAGLAVANTYARSADSVVELSIGTSVIVNPAVDVLLAVDSAAGRFRGVQVASTGSTSGLGSGVEYADDAPGVRIAREAMRAYRPID